MDASPELLKRLRSISQKRRKVWFKNKTSRQAVEVGIVDDEVSIVVGDGTYKHFIQRIRFTEPESWEGSTYGYRTGYFTIDRTNTRIVFGQYTQFLSEKDYRKLLSKARAKGWRI